MGNVWDRATEFLSDNLGTVTPIALMLILVPTSIEGNLAPLLATSNPTTVLVIRLMSVALAIVSLAGQLAITALAIDADRTAGAATAIARSRLLPAIVAVLVMILGALLLIVPMAALLVAMGVDPQAMMTLGAGDRLSSLAMPVGASWALACYGILAALAMLWLSARLILVYPVIVAEHLTVGALMRSFRLTRGLALPIIGVLLLYIVVSAVAGLAAKTVFGSIFAIIIGGDGPNVGTVLTSVIIAAIATAFTVLGAAFVAKLYLAIHGAVEPAAGAA